MNPLFFEVGTYVRLNGERVNPSLGLLPLEGLDHLSYFYGSVEQNNVVPKELKTGRIPTSLSFDAATLSKIDDPQKFIESLTNFGEVTFWIDSPPSSSFIKLCKEVSIAIPLRLALPGSITELEKIDFSSLAATFYDLLAFEYHTPKENGITQFHTILADREGPCIENTINYLTTQGIGLNKINLGLASYGKLYKNVTPGPEENGLAQESRGSQLANSNLSYREIEEYVLAHLTANLYHTSLDGVIQSFIYNSATGDWIAFDDPDTLRGKVQWAQDKGLHGVFLWSSDQDSAAFSELKAVEKEGLAYKKWMKM